MNKSSHAHAKPGQTQLAVQKKSAQATARQTTLATPRVYRPQPTPKVLQAKTAATQAATKTPRAQSHTKPTAPAAYHPQPIPKVLQTKQSIARQVAARQRDKTSPSPGKRVQPACVQTKSAPSSRAPQQPRRVVNSSLGKQVTPDVKVKGQATTALRKPGLPQAHAVSSAAQRIARRGQASPLPHASGRSHTLQRKQVQGRTFPQLSNRGSIVQLLGKNVDLVGEDDRFFETSTRHQRLRVNPDNDPYLEDEFNEATRALRTDSDLSEKLLYLLDHFKFKIPYNKQNKIDAFDSNVQPPIDGAPRQQIRSLGTMLHGKAATCWEKAAFFHLALAELGIPSKLEGGVKKSNGVGHAWTVLDNGIVLDPTSKKIERRSDFVSRYNVNVAPKQIATPKVAVSASDLRNALTEVHRLIGTGGLVEKANLQLVELRIEKQKNEERLAKQSEEWDRLLSGFSKSLVK